MIYSDTVEHQVAALVIAVKERRTLTGGIYLSSVHFCDRHTLSFSLLQPSE